MENTEIIIENIPKGTYSTKYTDLSVKRIKKIERLVRCSFEYEIFAYFLKHTLDLNRCAYYEGYSMTNSFGIELHHHPISLFDITYAIANKYLLNSGYFESMKVAEDVTYLHYNFHVGLVPLNPTAHQLFHNDQLLIHPDLVKGNWEQFIIDYKEYLLPETLLKVQEAREFQKNHDPKEYPNILKRKEQIMKVPEFISLDKFNVSKMLTDVSISKLNQL